MLGFLFNDSHFSLGQTDQTESKLQSANNAMDQAFNAVSAAEKAGANVTSLLAQFNVAADNLAQAENSYQTGDFTVAAAQADSALSIAQEVTNDAQQAKQNALVSGQNLFWDKIIITMIETLVLILALFLVWRWFKSFYIKHLSETKLDVNRQ